MTIITKCSDWSESCLFPGAINDDEAGKKTAASLFTYSALCTTGAYFALNTASLSNPCLGVLTALSCCAASSSYGISFCVYRRTHNLCFGLYAGPCSILSIPFIPLAPIICCMGNCCERHCGSHDNDAPAIPPVGGPQPVAIIPPPNAPAIIIPPVEPQPAAIIPPGLSIS